MTLTIKRLDGSARDLDPGRLEALAGALRGDLLTRESPGYEAARSIWNGTAERRPALIARCAGAADAIAAVRFANEEELLISVRGGGHNIAGSALCEGGMTIDLSAMRGVRVDPVARRAWVQAGALLGDVDHETQAHGLAVPTGINSTTGIAGLALGGGFGWLSRAFGHTVDNLIGADMVLADGRAIHVSADEHPDLFWAIRGGGGNFGLVTGFEFQLHPVGPTIMSGPIVHPIEAAADLMRRYREIADTLPDEATAWIVLRKAPPLPFLDPKDHGRPVMILVLAYAGPLEEGEAALAPLRALGQPLADAVGPHPFTGWQAAFDPLLTAGARNYWKSHDFDGLSDELIDILLGAVSTLPGDECEIFVAQLGGAAGRVPADATAFAHRATRFTMNVHGRWREAAEDATCIGWVRDLFTRTAPLSNGSVYINFEPDADEKRNIGPFGANEARLSAIKADVDPRNLFRANVPITPA